MKNVRSNQASISVYSCTELSKTQFFPMSTVNKDWIVLTYFVDIRFVLDTAR